MCLAFGSNFFCKEYNSYKKCHVLLLGVTYYVMTSADTKMWLVLLLGVSFNEISSTDTKMWLVLLLGVSFNEICSTDNKMWLVLLLGVSFNEISLTDTEMCLVLLLGVILCNAKYSYKRVAVAFMPSVHWNTSNMEDLKKYISVFFEEDQTVTTIKWNDNGNVDMKEFGEVHVKFSKIWYSGRIIASSGESTFFMKRNNIKMRLFCQEIN